MFVVKLLVKLLLLSFLSLQLFAQEVALTDDQVNSAIQYDKEHQKAKQGLYLEDQSKNVLNAINAVANMNQPYSAQHHANYKGFSVQAFTPTTWIRQKAAEAAKEYREFMIADVTEDMRRPVLYIIIFASKSKDGEQIFGESVQHVVIRSESRSKVLQPLKIESFGEGQQNIFGASEEYVGRTVTFSLEEVQKVRMASPDGEFFVTVIGENSEKNFKIKKKHFEKLP